MLRGGSDDAFSLNLTDSQLAAVKVEPVEAREFPIEKEAVGAIDFNEDMQVQVFTPYQGRIIALYASIGDDVGHAMRTLRRRNRGGGGPC